MLLIFLLSVAAFEFDAPCVLLVISPCVYKLCSPTLMRYIIFFLYDSFPAIPSVCSLTQFGLQLEPIWILLPVLIVSPVPTLFRLKH